MKIKFKKKLKINNHYYFRNKNHNKIKFNK